MAKDVSKLQGVEWHPHRAFEISSRHIKIMRHVKRAIDGVEIECPFEAAELVPFCDAPITWVVHYRPHAAPVLHHLEDRVEFHLDGFVVCGEVLDRHVHHKPVAIVPHVEVVPQYQIAGVRSEDPFYGLDRLVH
jgi:hypothetical protein